LEMFEMVAQSRKLAINLNVDSHPKVKAIFAQGRAAIQTSGLLKTIADIVYSLDGDSKFTDVSDAQRTQSDAKMRSNAIPKEFKQARAAPQDLYYVAIHDHFRKLVDRNAFYSIIVDSSDAGNLLMLDNVLQQRRAMCHAATSVPIRRALAIEDDIEMGEGEAQIESALLVPLVVPSSVATSMPSATSTAPELTPSTAIMVPTEDPKLLEPLSSRHRVFFRVVMASPSRKKLMPVAPAAGNKLQSSDILVTVHGVEPCGLPGRGPEHPDGHQVIVSTAPTSTFVSSNCVVLRHLGRSNQIIRSDFLQWETQSTPHYRLNDSSLSDDEQAIVARLVQEQAFVGTTKQTFLPILAPDILASISLHILQTKGYIQCGTDANADSNVFPSASPSVTSTWQLTAAGMGLLRCGSQLLNPKPICDIRQYESLPIQNWTGFELLCQLEKLGWVMRLLTKRIKDRPLDYAYSVGQPLVWYASGQTVSGAYLRCLLSAHRILETTGQPIEHGRRAKEYAALLAGRPLAPSRARLAIEDDLDDRVEDLDGRTYGRRGVRRAADAADAADLEPLADAESDDEIIGADNNESDDEIKDLAYARFGGGDGGSGGGGGRRGSGGGILSCMLRLCTMN
jgi:hypothetical protein